MGIECLAVNPAGFPNSQKDSLQKKDPRDARNLGLRLQSGVLRGIHIPDEQQEADRVLFRHRKRIRKDLTRCENRIKGLLAFTGVDIPEQYDNANWSHNFINWLKALDCKQQSRRRALDYMIKQKEFLRKELLDISNAIRKMMREQRYNSNYYRCAAFPVLVRSLPPVCWWRWER